MQPKQSSGPKSRPSEASSEAGPVRPARGGIRTETFYFVLLVALAAALRLAYTFGSRHSPFFDHLDLDTKFYDSWAKQIAAGNWIGREVFFMGPLYPYFLAVVYKIFGPSLLAAKALQSLVGAFTVGFIYLLAREAFGVGVGIIAGLLAALYVPFIFYDNMILLPVLATLLNTLMLYFLYRGIRRSSMRAFLVAGVFAGLSAVGNASVLAFAPLALGFVLVYGKLPLEVRIRRALLVAAGIAVVVAPVLIRNYAVGKDLVPLTSNAGLNFYIGNNAASTGAYVKPEGLDIYTDPSGRAIAERSLGRPLKPSQVSTYWRDRGLAYIRARPGAFVSNMLRKFFFFWSVYEIPQIEHLPFERQYSWILRLPTPSFGAVAPLGIVGIILALRRRKDAWLLFLFILAYSASIVTFFVVARYRLPMVPALMVFASYFLFWLISQGAEGRWRSVASSLVGFLVLFIIVHINFYRIHPLNGFAQSYYRLGIIYEGKSDPSRALANYRKALELDPSIVAAHVNLGIMLSRQGDYEDAKRELGEAARLDPKYDKALYNLGLVYAEAGQSDSAMIHLDRALELNPGYSLAKLAKAGAYYERADLANAESLLVALRNDPTLASQSKSQVAFLLKLLPERGLWVAARPLEREKVSDRYLLRGDNLASLGLSARALEAYLRAAEIDSLSAPAHFQAGTIYFDRGDLDGATGEFDRVLAVSPSYSGAHFARGVVAYRKGDVGLACREFEAEIKVDPESGAAHINLAMCYEERLKNLDLAAYHLRRYIELTGGTPELRNHLKDLETKISGSVR